MDYMKIGLIFILVTVSLAYAGFLDPILDPIENFFRNLTNQVEAELDRTRVGRELNRIIEDIEGVARIVNEIQSIATVLSSVSPPIAIINLATQYGHDPSDLFDRFKERVHSLENNYPGSGGGSSGNLSNTEIAAALQSVLEEPALPTGVYMGDDCIIDLTQCDFNDPSRASQYRDSFFSYSCYVEGIVAKKSASGLNRATCRATWINTWSGNVAPVHFLYDNQFANYYWDQCARVYLTSEEQNNFMQNKNCEQPIARHDLGDICAVDYTTCPANSTALSNAHRVGTIAYDRIPGTTRRSYFCELPFYGWVALDSSLRQSCEVVYVGQREVDGLLAAQPEVLIPPITPPITPPPPVQTTPPSPTEGLNNTGTLRFPMTRLGDLPMYVPPPSSEKIVYGRYNALDITPTVYKQKKIAADVSGEKNLSLLDEVKAKLVGQTIPDSTMLLFGNEKTQLEVRMNDGNAYYFCMDISDGVIKSLDQCKKDDPNFSPTLLVSVSQTVLQQLKAGEDPEIFFEAVDQGRADYEGVGFFNKLKYDILTFMEKVGLFSLG
ncbi:MAG: hypothetical protein ABH842_05655 [Candidatus Micrarchaeota archaeon]